ncbi:MAG: hypothetical protein V1934_07080 [Methanobacteriota archaeon]
MNEKDVVLMNKFVNEVSGKENGHRVLLSVKYNQICKINLILLRALIGEQGKHGLFVTVDRPHQYMTYLLDLHKIPRDGLIFLDIISRFSGESIKVCDTDVNTASPFRINELLDLLEHGGGGRDSRTAKIDFGLLDFIMIDNLGAMLSYNELDDVAAFIQRYLRLVERYGKLFTAIVIDVRAQPALYKAVQGLCQQEFLVADDGTLVLLATPNDFHEPEKKMDEIAESVLLYAPDSPRIGAAHPRPVGGA